ncbi:MAG: hypothetical protein ABIS59_01015 [Candidatus Saccharibacteria bacterium]
MPYINCNYSQRFLNQDQVYELVSILLQVSQVAFGYSEAEAKDLVSIFTIPYGLSDHSVAVAEIEVRAKISEFDDHEFSRDEVRDVRMVPYKEALTDFIARHALPAGIVFTITFEDWNVIFVPGTKVEDEPIETTEPVKQEEEPVEHIDPAIHIEVAEHKVEEV